ncbi:MAG: recombinase RecT [Cetobacterium sp.]
MEVQKVSNSLGKTKEEKPAKNILELIKASEKQFALALPKYFNSERFTRIALTTIRTNRELAKCSQESLLGSLMVLAQLGLEAGVLGQAYLIPFNNKKLGTIECQLQIGYKGLIELLRRSGQLSDIYTYTVYKNDFFDITYGLKRDLIHKPNFQEERGEILGFYAVALLKDGTNSFEYMTKEEIEKHEIKYRKGNYQNSIWVKNFEEMAQKTVIKKLLKLLPVSVELLEKINTDNSIILSKDLNNLENTEIDEIDEFYVNDEIIEIVEN